jgi:hypothetical protein
LGEFLDYGLTRGEALPIKEHFHPALRQEFKQAICNLRILGRVADEAIVWTLFKIPGDHGLLDVGWGRISKNGALGVGEFLVAAVVAAVVDEFLGGGEVSRRGLPLGWNLAKRQARREA